MGRSPLNPPRCRECGAVLLENELFCCAPCVARQRVRMRCRACGGSGRIETPFTGGDRPCAACDGTGVA